MLALTSSRSILNITLFRLTMDKKPSSVSDSAPTKRRSWSLGFNLKGVSRELLPMSPELEFAVKLVGWQNARALKTTMTETDLCEERCRYRCAFVLDRPLVDCLTHQKFQVQELPLRNQVQIANALDRLTSFRDSEDVLAAFRQFRVPEKRRRRSTLRIVEPDLASALIEELGDWEDVIPLYYFRGKGTQ